MAKFKFSGEDILMVLVMSLLVAAAATLAVCIKSRRHRPEPPAAYQPLERNVTGQ